MIIGNRTHADNNNTVNALVHHKYINKQTYKKKSPLYNFLAMLLLLVLNSSQQNISGDRATFQLAKYVPT